MRYGLGGENKNRFTLGYLCWRTLMGLHKKITLCTQIQDHGRCLVDAGFANIKRLYRRSDVDSISSMLNVVNQSSKSNEAVPYIDSAGEHTWEWYDWKRHLSQHFKPLKGIRKIHHFRFDSSQPGKVFVKERHNSPEKAFTLLKSRPEHLTVTVMPPVLQPAGFTSEREDYFYKMIRPFVRDPFKNITCPAPEE